MAQVKNITAFHLAQRLQLKPKNWLHTELYRALGKAGWKYDKTRMLWVEKKPKKGEADHV